MLYDRCLELSYQIIVKNQFSNSDLIDNLQLVRAGVKSLRAGKGSCKTFMGVCPKLDLITPKSQKTDTF